MQDISTIGFVGLGVMGAPMCANLVRKSGLKVLAHDTAEDAAQRTAAAGAVPVETLGALVEAADLVLLSLPGAPQVEAVCLGGDGIIAHARAGLAVADLSTTSVAAARKVGAALAAAGVAFADAPVTRTTQAAVEGTLSFMVGGERALFDRLVPIFRHMGTDFSHCGAVGSGQVLKLLNNMVCMQTVVALAEALTMGRRAGVDGEVLFETLTRGSADSFALRNHGMKSMLPGVFAEKTYSCLYALKDLGYALELAQDTCVDAPGAALAYSLIEAARDMGHGTKYYPVLLKAVEGKG